MYVLVNMRCADVIKCVENVSTQFYMYMYNVCENICECGSRCAYIFLLNISYRLSTMVGIKMISVIPMSIYWLLCL